MFQGTTSKLSEEVIASAATITPRKDLVRITGTAAIVNINGQFGGGFSGVMFVIPLALFTWTAAGNIAIAGTAVVNRTIIFTFSKATGKWYPSYLS